MRLLNPRGVSDGLRHLNTIWALIVMPAESRMAERCSIRPARWAAPAGHTRAGAARQLHCTARG